MKWLLFIAFIVAVIALVKLMSSTFVDGFGNIHLKSRFVEQVRLCFPNIDLLGLDIDVCLQNIVYVAISEFEEASVGQIYSYYTEMFDKIIINLSWFEEAIEALIKEAKIKDISTDGVPSYVVIRNK